MFNLSGSEIVVILLLALVVLGPEKLPDALRRAGRTYAELKKMGNSFQEEVKSALDEPMKEMRETADLIRKSADLTGDDAKPGAAKPGAGNRATPPPAAAATAAVAATSPPAAASPEPIDSASDVQPVIHVAPPVLDDDELINRTLSGGDGPPVAPSIEPAVNGDGPTPGAAADETPTT